MGLRNERVCSLEVPHCQLVSTVRRSILSELNQQFQQFFRLLFLVISAHQFFVKIDSSVGIFDMLEEFNSVAERLPLLRWGGLLPLF